MSAISDDTQDGLAIHKVQPRKLADLHFGLDQHAILALTDIRGTIVFVNKKFCAIRVFRAAVPCHRQWEGLLRKRARPKDSPTCWVDITSTPPGIFYLPQHSEQFNTNRSQLTGQLKQIDGGLEWEDRKS
jgi:hypothetical protein